MGYQPDARAIPPGDHMPPLAIISPVQVERMNKVALERHQMTVEEMYANLAYWSRRWKRFSEQRAYRKSTRQRRKRMLDEATEACINWSTRLGATMGTQRMLGMPPKPGVNP